MDAILTDSITRFEMLDCSLCVNAPCTAACPKSFDCAGALRRIWMDNEEYASMTMPENAPCLGCDAPCERLCIKAGKVEIKKLMSRLSELKARDHQTETVDFSVLKTDICGIELENPFLLSSSVVASSYEKCARAFEAGWAGVCFKTISSLDIHEASPRYSAIEGDNGTILGFKNIEQLSDHSLAEDMAIFRKLKENYPGKFVLASIMGQNEDEWRELALLCEKNGADAVELNFSCPHMAEGGLGSDIGQVPELVEKFTAAAKSGCSIPVLVKLTPNAANMTPAAQAAVRGGADGISAINTIKSITGINLHTYVAEPAVHGLSALGGYSGPAVKPIALRFIMELGKLSELEGKHISAMGGIETWRDAAEFILLGAKTVQLTTAVMKYGNWIIEDLKSGLALYMNQKGFRSIKELAGEGLQFVYSSTDVLERDTVIYPRIDKEKCNGCGRCVLSCTDGGHEALTLKEDRSVFLNAKECVGCHLCALVCPEKAIKTNGRRVSKKKN